MYKLNDYAQYVCSSEPRNIIIFQVKEIHTGVLGDGNDYYPIESCKKLTLAEYLVMVRYNKKR